MKNLQKAGGVAALYMAAAYVAGMVFFLLVLNYTAVVEPAQKLASLVNNQAGMYVMTLVDYVIFGVFLVVLALALHERLKKGAPAIMQIATALGLIWAGMLIASGMVFNVGMTTVVELYGEDPLQAASIWLAVDSVAQGLSGNGEVLGGLWTLLVSWVALRTGGLPKGLNYLGLLVGAVGIVSAVPALEDLMAVFGLGQIVWFVWLGIVMLRKSPGVVEKPAAFASSPAS